jgi:H+/Cl- antiporter ClcA
MSLIRFIKSAGFGISLALIVLIVGLAIQTAWLVLGLPGVRRTVVAPTTPINLVTRVYDRSETISESYADISFVPSYILAAVGLVSGFWWVYRRDPARRLRAGNSLRCSFCNREEKDVKKLIAGPNVFICDECVETCREVIAGGGGSSDAIRYDGARVSVRFGPRSKG